MARRNKCGRSGTDCGYQVKPENKSNIELMAATTGWGTSWKGVIPSVAIKEKRGRKIKTQPKEEPYCITIIPKDEQHISTSN